MRNNISIIYTAVLLVLLTACQKNFLDRAPSVNLPEEKVFADPVLASQYADNAYNFLVNDYARLNDHRGITGQAADEAVSSTNDVAIRTLTNGTYHDHYEKGGEGINDIRDVYTRAYSGIRITNMVLSRLSTIPWTANQSPERIEGEMHFLRAFYYFDLIKRFGGVPLIEQAFAANDDIDFPRSSYDECVQFILKDLDRAEQVLPLDYDNSGYGRATQGAAKALRSRVLLFAASKLNNESDNPEKWKAAAEAARAVIDMNRYTLDPNYATLLNVPQSPEYIMIKVRGPRSATDGKLMDFSVSVGSGGAQGSLNPTQNHVDLYEAVKKDNTGKIISSGPISDPATGYNPQKPYDNRDPRFYANIIYNDESWQGRRIGMWSQTAANGSVSYGADYRPANPNYTITRYYCRKMWPEQYKKPGGGSTYINYIFFRYGEILLNYAEAMNEAYGADVTPSGYTLTARQAVNQIRDRVGMPNLPTGLSKDDMRSRIRNERAVELAFEDFRWYDIMRWKAGPEIVAQPMYGMDVVKNTNGSFTYTPVLLPQTFQKVYLDYMHRYPIPRSEVYKSNGILTQNPGW